MVERYVGRVQKIGPALVSIVSLVGCTMASAADTLEEVVVFARGEQQIGKAAAASEGAVGGDDVPMNLRSHGIAMIHDHWEASLRVRHLGEYPLIEDNSLRADAETSVNLRGVEGGAFLRYAGY